MMPNMDVPPRESEPNPRPQVPWHQLVTILLAIILYGIALWYVPDLIARWR